MYYTSGTPLLLANSLPVWPLAFLVVRKVKFPAQEDAMSTQARPDMMTTWARHNLVASINALFDAQNNLEDEERQSGIALAGVVRELNEGSLLDQAAAQRLALTIDAAWQAMTQSIVALHTAQGLFNVDVNRALKK